MRRLMGMTQCLVILSLFAVLSVTAETASSLGKVVGQPVAQDIRPKSNVDYKAMRGFSLERVVSGLSNPMAISADQNGNTYIADGVKPATVNIIKLDKNGTANTIARGIDGTVSSMVYNKGFLYVAMDSPKGEIIRIGSKSGTKVTLYKSSDTGKNAPQRILDIVQNPGSKNTDLYILDKNPATKVGALWRLSGSQDTASTSTVANPVRRGTVNRSMLSNPWVAGLSLLGLVLFTVIAWILMRRPRV